MRCLLLEVWYTHKYTRTTLNSAKVPFQKAPTTTITTTCCFCWDVSEDSGKYWEQMHKDGGVWDSPRLNPPAECKSRRTGVTNATWMIFLGKYCRLYQHFVAFSFSTHHIKANDCELFYEQPHQFLRLITWSENFKRERQQDSRDLHIFTETADVFILFIARRQLLSFPSIPGICHIHRGRSTSVS